MQGEERVVVIGLDAMDAGIARRLADAGRLPTIASLLQSGAWAATRNPYGLVVGGIWPSFATATWPSRHGFYCFRQLEAGTYEIGRFTSVDVLGSPFWTALSAAGKRCAVVDVPLSAPTTVNGIEVIDWGSHDRMLPPQAAPAGLLGEISDRFGAHTITGKCDDYRGKRALARLRDDLLAGVERKLELSTWLLERDDWDLFVTVFSESHCADHQFWFLQDPRYPGHDADLQRALDRPLEQVYEALDGAVARLLELAGAATVFVLLSHGVGPHFDGDHLLAELLRRIEDADDAPSTARRLREAAIRRARRARRAMSGASRRGGHRLVSVDSSRKFFKIPNNELYGGIRFNVVGREPRGRVQRGPELDQLFQQLRADLLSVVNDETGRPAVREVVRTDDVYDRAELDGLPDVLVDWDRSDPIRAVRSPKVGTIRGEYDGIRSGDHRPSGLLLARGPGIAPGMLDEPVPIVDLGPTIAARLGVELAGVDGRPVDRLAATVTRR